MCALQCGADDPRDRQVLVLGTGVAGLATAVACREREFDPVVAGSAPDFGSDSDRDGDRVLTLWRPTVTLLEGLGLGDALADGTPVRRWVYRHADGTAEETLVHEGDPASAPCVRVRRTRLKRALAASVSTRRLQPDRGVRGVERGRSGPVVTFADGVRERFDLMVGADGPGSQVRDVVDDTASDGGGSVVVASTGVSHRAPRLEARDTVYEHVSPEGAVTRVGPLDGGDVWRHVGATRTDRWVGPERWTGHGVALVGAAARPLSPVLTTRDSLAVEDATTLAAVLASRPTVRAALRTYERRRRHRLRTLYGMSRADDGTGAETLTACRRAFLRTAFGRRDESRRPDGD